MKSLLLVVGVLCVMSGAACRKALAPTGPVDADATTFLKQTNDTMLRLGNQANQASWVQETFITPDTEALAAHANEVYMTAITDAAKRAASYDNVQLPADQRRQMTMLKNSLTMAAPADPKEAEELSKVAASMESAYGKGKYCGDSAAPKR